MYQNDAPDRCVMMTVIIIIIITKITGGGKGSWSAWKAGELARRYEAEGGDYKDTGDNKNKAQKGAPEKKE